MVEFHRVTSTVGDGVVLNGWCTRQGHREVIVFTHGNGFCCRVYQPMLELLAEHFDLLMFDIPGHGESPASKFVGFNKTAEYLYQAVDQSDEIIQGRNAHAVAHSLGGMVTLLAVSKYPKTFTSVVLLDPIMFPKPLLLLMHIVKKLGLTEIFHPHIKSTLRRRNGWSDEKQAYSYFNNRKVFKNWTNDALNSYVRHALKESGPAQGTVDVRSLVLRCEPELEAQWFGTLPSGFWKSIDRLKIPVSIYMGQGTYPFSLRAGKYAEKINSRVTYSEVPGGHCFMQEYPQQAADYVANELATDAV